MIEKLKAMESNSRKPTGLQSLLKFFLTTLSLGLFLSSPLWLPLIFSFLEALAAAFFEPKCLFVACNVIVAILFGQSKLSMSSPTCDIYEEYVSRNKRLQGLSGTREDHENNIEVVEERREVRDDDDEEEEEEEGDNGGLDELKKRVEEFIARVNKQRRIEARMDYGDYGGYIYGE